MTWGNAGTQTIALFDTKQDFDCRQNHLSPRQPVNDTSTEQAQNGCDYAATFPPGPLVGQFGMGATNLTANTAPATDRE